MAEVKRSQRFKVVLQLAERQEQEAANQVGRYQQQLQRERQQLQQLHDYNLDYQKKFGSQTRGLRGADLISSRGFLARLATAESEQQANLERMQKTLESLQQTWRQKYHYRQSIENLIARFSQEESEELEKRLQKEFDDLAAQRRIQ